MAPSSSALLVAGSAALLAVAAYSIQPDSSSTKDLEELDEADCITPEDVCNIFDKLFLEMQAKLAQLSHTVQQIQMTGQQFSEHQLRALLKGEYERHLLAKQGAIFEEFDVDEDCLEEATFEFLEKEDEYPKVKKSVERFQKLYESVSGESVVGKKRGALEEPAQVLSKEELLVAAETFFVSQTAAVKGIVTEIKAEEKDLNDRAVARELQMRIGSEINDAGENALKERGVSLKSFQKSVEKHATDPQVAQTLTMLQMQQQRELVALGLPQM